MTDQRDIFLSEAAVLQAFAQSEQCPDCATQDGGERVLCVSPSRGEFGIYSRHAATCPSLSADQRAAADAWWRGLREHDAAEQP